METGETLEEGIAREVLEETGLRIEVVDFYGIFQRIMRDAKGRAEYHYLLIDYVCKVAGGTLRAGDDVARVEWVPRRDRKSTRLNSSHSQQSRMPSSA